MPNPSQSPTKTMPDAPTTPEKRPYIDPDQTREPAKICPQQKREQGFESI